MRWLFLVLLFMVGNLTAQSDSSLTKRERFSQHLKSLKLSFEQEVKLRKVYMNRRQAIQKRKDENKLFHESLNKKTKDDIEKVLTPEQQLEYEKLMLERKESKKRPRNYKNKKSNLFE